MKVTAFGEMKMKRVTFLHYLSQSVWTKMIAVLRCVFNITLKTFKNRTGVVSSHNSDCYR